jgi:hypothetical protein
MAAICASRPFTGPILKGRKGRETVLLGRLQKDRSPRYSRLSIANADRALPREAAQRKRSISACASAISGVGEKSSSASARRGVDGRAWTPGRGRRSGKTSSAARTPWIDRNSQDPVLAAFPVPVAQRRLVELAGRKAREIVLEIDRPRTFHMREMHGWKYGVSVEGGDRSAFS